MLNFWTDGLVYCFALSGYQFKCVKMQASHHSGMNRAGLSLIVPTSSICSRMARLCLWSARWLTLNKPVVELVAAMPVWHVQRLRPGSCLLIVIKIEWVVRMETVAEHLHHSVSRWERSSLLHIQMQMLGGSTRICLGPCEEHRLIAELPQPPPGPLPPTSTSLIHSPSKKTALVSLVASLIISKALNAAFTTFAQHHIECKHTQDWLGERSKEWWANRGVFLFIFSSVVVACAVK